MKCTIFKKHRYKYQTQTNRNINILKPTDFFRLDKLLRVHLVLDEDPTLTRTIGGCEQHL